MTTYSLAGCIKMNFFFGDVVLVKVNYAGKFKKRSHPGF